VDGVVGYYVNWTGVEFFEGVEGCAVFTGVVDVYC
jgi:hypothetical protein